MKTRFRILVATLLAFVCTTGTWAQSITSYGITYTVSSGKAYVSSVDAGKTILRISEKVTINCTSLNNVQLGTQLRKIGEAAFYDCSELTSISLPGSLNYIGFNAFRNTQIKTIEIPSGIVPVSNNFYTNASEVTVKVAAGNASIYKQLHGWNESAFTFVEEGQKGISFRADARDKDIELWSGGVKIRTISPAAASFSQTVNMPTDLELRIPVRYFSRILINGSSQPSYYTTSTPTDEAYSGYRFYTLPDLTYVSSIEVQFNYAPEHGIHFADATVKAICVENWDTNGDGELSVAEAAAVTTLREDNGDGTYKLFVPEGKKQAYIDAGWTENVFKGGIYEIPEYDANGDGQTTIVDVTRLVDKIIGR